jgi:Tol biopolymer transport system component
LRAFSHGGHGAAPENSEPLRAVPLTTLTGVQSYPSWSPDGNYVAFTWTGQKHDNPDVYVQQIGSAGSPLRLTSEPGNDYNPLWWPGGRLDRFPEQPIGNRQKRIAADPAPGRTGAQAGGHPRA